MKTTALIELGRDGTFGIFTPDLKCTIIGNGDTVEEAKEDFNIGVEEMIASYTENGEAIPKELQDLEFEYKYDLPSFFKYCPMINASGFARYIGMNPTLLLQYKLGRAYISEKQLQRIEDGIHRLGNMLLEVKFSV